MIKAISYWSMPNGLSNTHSIDDALHLANAAHFDGIELCFGEDGVLSTDTTRDQCELIREAVDEQELILETMASGVSWVHNPTSDSKSTRRRSIDLHKTALERAAWLGCKSMLYVPGVVASPINSDKIRYDIAMTRAREACDELLEVAERVGVELCVENVWNGMMYSPIELCDFIDSFSSTRLGVYFDIGNVLGYHQYPPHWIELLGDRIKRVHVKDYKLHFDWKGKFEFCDLGDGDVPWEETMAALRSIGYDRTLVAEILPYRDGILERTSASIDHLLNLRSAECA